MTPRSAPRGPPAAASHAAANSSNEAAPARRAQSRSATEFAGASDLELTELGLVLLEAFLKHEHQSLGRIGIEHDPVGQEHAYLLLVRAPGLVRTEQQRHFLSRAEHIADVRIGRIHLRVVPDDLRLLCLR